jgi:hypothetical protein
MVGAPAVVRVPQFEKPYSKGTVEMAVSLCIQLHGTPLLSLVKQKIYYSTASEMSVENTTRTCDSCHVQHRLALMPLPLVRIIFYIITLDRNFEITILMHMLTMWRFSSKIEEHNRLRHKYIASRLLLPHSGRAYHYNSTYIHAHIHKYIQ